MRRAFADRRRADRTGSDGRGRSGHATFASVIAVAVMWASVSASVPAPGSSGPAGHERRFVDQVIAEQAAVSGAGAPSALMPVGPVRLFDSRTTSSPLLPGADVTVDVTGTPGVPSTAVAAVVNITATNTSGPLWVSAYPAGTAWPGTSSVNVPDKNRTVAALTTVPLGHGAFSLRTMAATDVVVDLTAVLIPAPGPVAAGRLQAFTPIRALDTRTGPPLAAGQERTVALHDAAVPTSASAVVLTVTMTRTAGPGYVTFWPHGTPRPLTSAINADHAGQTVTNQVIVGVTASQVDVFAPTGTDLVVDVAGWYSGASDAADVHGRFVPLTPTRVLDTRLTASPTAGSRAAPYAPVTIPPVASDAVAFVGTLTVVDTQGPLYVTAYAAGGDLPLAASLATDLPHTMAGTQITAPMSTLGTSLLANDMTHLVVDVEGYYTGTPYGPKAPTTTPPSGPSTPPVTGTHAFLFPTASGGERWDPCTTITYTVTSGAGTPAFAASSLSAAIAAVAAASGLKFEDVTGTPAGATAPAKVVFTMDANATHGAAGIADTWESNQWIVSGTITMNDNVKWQPGWGYRGLTEGLAHEFGHLVGLAHVSDQAQAMYPILPNLTGFGNGDREGLWWVGAAQGCRAH